MRIIPLQSPLFRLPCKKKKYVKLGDLSVVLDDKVKELVCKLSGKDEYEFGDLSVQIDIRSKKLVAEFCGKEDYEFGDLSRELARRTREGVLNYTGKSDYKFGDLTKQALKNLSGKEDYQVCVVYYIFMSQWHMYHVLNSTPVLVLSLVTLRRSSWEMCSRRIRNDLLVSVRDCNDWSNERKLISKCTNNDEIEKIIIYFIVVDFYSASKLFIHLHMITIGNRGMVWKQGDGVTSL